MEHESLAGRLIGVLTRALVRPSRRRTRPSRKVAVVVPLPSRSDLLPDEIVSMRHLRHFLWRYDKYVLAPRGTDRSYDGFTTLYFHPKFFGSAAAHNRLNYWPRLYQAFEDYEYVLIYHLDSLVFSDQLLRWCDAGFDYIGAPWIPCPDTPWVREPRVGNGGFTLMNVRAALDVLYARYHREPWSYWSDLLVRNEERLRPLRAALQWLRRRGVRTTLVEWPLRQWAISDDPASHGYNNDYLWAFHASRYAPGYAVAPVEEGLRFAFEASPRQCFERNGRQLPFGCHAWARFDRDFWVPYLLPDTASTS